MLTLRWLKKQGGIPAIEPVNRKKAALVYDTIDQFPIYKGQIVKEDRSMMNACFRIEDAALEKEFLQELKSHGMVGVKGHRSSGGFRISLYNALQYDSVIAITNLMKDFATRKG